MGHAWNVWHGIPRAGEYTLLRYLDNAAYAACSLVVVSHDECVQRYRRGISANAGFYLKAAPMNYVRSTGINRMRTLWLMHRSHSQDKANPFDCAIESLACGIAGTLTTEQSAFRFATLCDELENGDYSGQVQIASLADFAALNSIGQ